MPKKKKPPETKEAQSGRFRAEVQRLVDAGELDLTDAEEAFERLARKLSAQKPH